MSGEIVIRETVPADLAAIVEVHKKGFGYGKAEADVNKILE